MKNIVINRINEEKITKTSLSSKNLGKGRVLKTIDKLLLGVASVFEVLREIPGFEYLKTISISNLTTKFNIWLSRVFPADVPDFNSLTPLEAYELGKQISEERVSEMANTLGLLFSAVLEFILSHPTVTVLGVTALTSTLIIPFKVMIRKLQGEKEVTYSRK